MDKIRKALRKFEVMLTQYSGMNEVVTKDHKERLLNICNEAQNQVNNFVLDPVSELSISENDKIVMAGEWSRSRSEGDREQDRQCNYDYVMGMEAAIRKLNAR